MFIHWVRRKFVGTTDHPQRFACIHEDPNARVLRPVVKNSFRDGYTSRHIVIWQPGSSIRSCCAKDQKSGFVRTKWWNEVAGRFAKLRDENLLEKKDWIVSRLGLVVPFPSLEDRALWRSWVFDKLEVGRRPLEPKACYYRRRLAEAEALMRQSHLRTFSALDLEWPCTTQEVVRAFRKKVREKHPDGGGSCEAFIQWNAAYERAISYLKSLESKDRCIPVPDHPRAAGDRLLGDGATRSVPS